MDDNGSIVVLDDPESTDNHGNYGIYGDPRAAVKVLSSQLEKAKKRIANLERTNRLLTVKLDKISRDCACNLSDAVRFRRRNLELEEQLKESEKQRTLAENWNKVYEQETVSFKKRMKAGQEALERLKQDNYGTK